MKKTTVVIGVSPRPERYAYKAVERLVAAGHPVYAIGISEGEVCGVEIQKELPKDIAVDTVTLYILPKRQQDYYDAIIGLHPKRVIFNPGTENPEFAMLLHKNHIQVLEQCTLVMLSVKSY